MNKLLNEIRIALKEHATIENQMSAKRFFKEGEKAKVYGVKAADVRKIAKEVKSTTKDKNKLEIFSICEQLWKSQYLEEAIIACVLSESQTKNFERSDFKIFEYWLKNYVNNWADCDTFCNHTIGNFILKYPEFLSELKAWTQSDKRFVRRAAAVSLILPARKGIYTNEIFEIAQLLLLDSDDLVQKGYGWMLKELCKTKLDDVYDFIIEKKEIMPRTALRYAIEKMPYNMKEFAMSKTKLNKRN